MICNTSEQNIQDLQLEIINLLEKINTSLVNARKNLIADRSEEKLVELNEAIENVKNLELRMAIVAPMKAGKSTIINAIVGQEILPSRNTAMTTIPTEIVLNNQLEEPLLILDEDILTVIEETYLILHKRIEALNWESLQEEIGAYPHLVELLNTIKHTKLYLEIYTYGCDNIAKNLKILNDLIRLSSILIPWQDPLAKFKEIPRIETPFWQSQNLEKIGNLVIVDTPGPNEAGEQLQLSAIVEEQLRKSSMVLIVLDFTQLNNKAASEIKKQVQTVLELIGKENLYVLINKVDQRRQGDMTTEQVRDFVCADLQLSKSSSDRKIFELSARQGFCATKFLMEIDNFPGVVLEELSTAQALAQEVLGSRWSEKLKLVNLDYLSEEAHYLWEESGYKYFLENAIKALISSAAPRCILSALNLVNYLLLELKDDANLYNCALNKNAEKIEIELQAIAADLKRLEVCRSRLDKVNLIHHALQENFQEKLAEIKKQARVALEDYYFPQTIDNPNYLETPPSPSNSLGREFVSFQQWISYRLKISFKASLDSKIPGIAEFISETGAKEFATQAFKWAKKRTETLLFNVRKNFQEVLDEALIELTNILEKETQPIIERSRQRLEEEFQFKLVLPKPNLTNEREIDLQQPTIASSIRYIDRGYGIRKIKKRSFNHWLWLSSFEVQQWYKKTDKQEKLYTVILEELVKSINQSLEQSLDNFYQEIDEYLQQELQTQIDLFFQSLDRYISKYRDNLLQAKEAQSFSLEKQAELTDKLQNLLMAIDEDYKDVNFYLEIAKKILKSSNLNGQGE